MENRNFADFIREFDNRQGRRRIKARITVSLPVELVLNHALPPSAGRVYGALKFLQIGTEPVGVSHRQLKELTGLSHHTVAKAIGRMKKHGWLIITPRSGDFNLYHFSQPPFK